MFKCTWWSNLYCCANLEFVMAYLFRYAQVQRRGVKNAIALCLPSPIYVNVLRNFELNVNRLWVTGWK